MSFLEYWELASYIVTVFGLPFAIVVFMYEQRRERQNEDEEIYQRLSDEYADFSRLLLENADLRLMSKETENQPIAVEHYDRKIIIFDLLVSLFERAFILVYEENMSPQTRRLWASWDDYIRSWCKRRDFREALGELLAGEDPNFGSYIRRVAQETEARSGAPRS